MHTNNLYVRDDFKQNHWFVLFRGCNFSLLQFCGSSWYRWPCLSSLCRPEGEQPQDFHFAFSATGNTSHCERSHGSLLHVRLQEYPQPVVNNPPR